MSDAFLEREVRAVRPVLDVSKLPAHAFGSRNEMWWGTAGFMLIEGVTLALVAASYFYLRKNFVTWPPYWTPQPDLFVPTINLAIMLGSLAPAWLAKQAAKRYDHAALRKWLLVLSALAVVILALRWYEFRALNTRWDTNAYGSAVWAILGVHAALLLADAVDTVGLTALVFRRRVERKFFSGAEDNSNYWYFIVWSWVVLYVIVFLGPRWY